MMLLRFARDETAGSAAEFGLIAPAFLSALMGAIGCGLALWAQIGLQHAAEMAARCASVDAATCGSVTATQNYAAQQAYGLSIPASAFSVTTQACGSRVSASYDLASVSGSLGLPSIVLTGQACFPK
jgi:Flp pilus assembly protein TadG